MIFMLFCLSAVAGCLVARHAMPLVWDKVRNYSGYPKVHNEALCVGKHVFECLQESRSSLLETRCFFG
jgi:hypothetical protein